MYMHKYAIYCYHTFAMTFSKTIMFPPILFHTSKPQRALSASGNLLNIDCTCSINIICFQANNSSIYDII